MGKVKLSPNDSVGNAESKRLPAAKVESDEKAFTLGEWLEQELLIHVIESYLRYYAAGEGHTARAKRYDLQYFLDFLSKGADPAQVRVSQWTMQVTKDFVDHRLSLGEAPSHVSRRLASVKHFGRTLAERVRGYVNPAREVKSPVIQQTQPRGLSLQEIEQLRNAAFEELGRTKNSFLSVRNHCLLELLLATGLRADEVRLLYISQISDDFSWLRNVKTKGRKFRNVYLDSQVREILISYLKLREDELTARIDGYIDLNLNDRSRFPVFVSTYRSSLSNPASFGLSPKTIWRIIANYGTKAQVLAGKQLNGLHPHKLRHTFAHGLLDTSKDVRLVAQALGHSDVRTTMRYTERTEQEVARAIERKVSSRR